MTEEKKSPIKEGDTVLLPSGQTGIVIYVGMVGSVGVGFVKIFEVISLSGRTTYYEDEINQFERIDSMDRD